MVLCGCEDEEGRVGSEGDVTRRKAPERRTQLHADAWPPADALPLDVGEGEPSALHHRERLEPDRLFLVVAAVAGVGLRGREEGARVVGWGGKGRVKGRGGGGERGGRVEEARGGREGEEDGAERGEVPGWGEGGASVSVWVA